MMTLTFDLLIPKTNQFICPKILQQQVWRKSVKEMEISQKQTPKMVFFAYFGHAVTLIFDLLTPKPNQLIYDPRYITDKSLPKIHQG